MASPCPTPWTAGHSTEHLHRGSARPPVLPSRSSLAALILILLALPAPPRAAEEDRGTGFAAALDREIEALTKELGSLGGEEATAAGEIESLSTREALSRRRFEKAAWQRDTVGREVVREEKRCADLDRAVETARARARAALREAYKGSAVPEYASLLSVEGPSDLLRAAQSLDVLARRQSEAVVGYRRSLTESEAASARLREKKVALERAAAEAALEETQLREDRKARLLQLDRLKKDRGLQESALDELKRAMGALSDSIRSLFPDSPPPRVSISFSRLEGALPWPAEGSVLHPFGSVRNPRFGTVTPHPGLEIRVEPAASVLSVGAGRVVFNRRYGSYGRTVVIDHGERYLSVYARLAASTAAEGDDVVPGQEIGFAEEADAHGKSSIYFEIRHQGKALDPIGWLRKPRSRAVAGGKP